MDKGFPLLTSVSDLSRWADFPGLKRVFTLHSLPLLPKYILKGGVYKGFLLNYLFLIKENKINELIV